MKPFSHAKIQFIDFLKALCIFVHIIRHHNIYWLYYGSI